MTPIRSRPLGKTTSSGRTCATTARLVSIGRRSLTRMAGGQLGAFRRSAHAERRARHAGLHPGHRHRHAGRLGFAKRQDGGDPPRRSARTAIWPAAGAIGPRESAWPNAPWTPPGAAPQFGNLGKNTLAGPGTNDWDHMQFSSLNSTAQFDTSAQPGQYRVPAAGCRPSPALRAACSPADVPMPSATLNAEYVGF